MGLGGIAALAVVILSPARAATRTGVLIKWLDWWRRHWPITSIRIEIRPRAGSALWAFCFVGSLFSITTKSF